MTAALSAVPDLVSNIESLVRLAGRSHGVLAVPENARAIAIAALARRSSRSPIVVAVPTTAEAERLLNDLRAFLGEQEVAWFPAWEILPFERVSPSIDTMGTRLELMWRLRMPDMGPRVIVAPVRALVQINGPATAEVEPIEIRPGDLIDSSQLVENLVGIGYRREFQVEHRGEIAVRGGIVDVFGATASGPVRIDLWGDEVDRLTSFSVADQRSIDDLDRVRLFPAREVLPTEAVQARALSLMSSEPWGREQWQRLADGDLFDGMESWLPWLVDDETVLFDLVGDDAQVLLIEPRRMRDRAGDLLAEEIDLAKTLAGTWGAVDSSGGAVEFPRLHVEFDRLLQRTEASAWTVVSVAEGPDTVVFESTAWEPIAGEAERTLAQMKEILIGGGTLVVAAEGIGSASRLVETLGAEGIQVVLRSEAELDRLSEPGGHVVVAPIERGVIVTPAGLGLLAESDVTGRRRTHRRARPRKRGQQGAFEALTEGDFVVHHHHGVARYAGMVTRKIMDVERDYLILEYKGTDKLYLPSDQIDLIRPYSGGESPALSKMGGADFQKAKARVKAAVREIAQELVVLYQRRITTEGIAFPEPTPWERELSDSFPFQETPDQLSAITDIQEDMEATAPMDRLVCGDVGFGKTEVAIRAVFKAVQAGKQAAVLVPTTLLAQQHHQTFGDRFAAFPVRVEVLSRFLTTAQQRKIIKAVKDGEVDVIIGTHRLLSSDIEFRDLGLLVVDEEQRFGVSHKEQIKKLQTDIDVLTLTATPIPRTLEMSLTGIRDLSLLQTPPAERQPILTYVGERDERAIAEAIRRELLREGQVFFVHNRIADIDHVADDLRSLVPEARIVIAHGQMDEGSLEQAVLDFWEGAYDVLVCTTIIESGIDMPSVNTLVVDRADLLGLGQLHQIRGRVGRSGQRAYAYLFHPRDRVLTEEAYERLKTIGEATELGSGFRIAMRDLEIRGAGNLLGAGQSGHIAAVGYDLYCQMVTEAVAELKGEPTPEPVEIKLDLPMPAFLPTDYVAREEHRLEAYRRLASVTSAGEVDDVEAEWLDRYGHLPEAARNLLELGYLRAACHQRDIREVGVLRNTIAKFTPLQLRISEQTRLKRLSSRAVYKDDVDEVHLPVKVGPGLAAQLVEFLNELRPQGESAGSLGNAM
ncbi:MAG: transcription-repair coupling factor [Actinomycetia bacterium]|nr:transcription-repair coupling factor [Actinomycetes bacterium]MCP4961227.1 transcription-repair coupling factor [Actinomycetes bacterium]